MKQVKSFIILILVVIITIFSCSIENTGPIDNEAPTVAIINPANNSELSFGQEITIIVNATDNVEVSEVEFYIDGELVSEDESEPYKFVWNTGNIRDVEHIIHAKAYDTSDNSTISDIVNVNVNTGNSGDFEWCDVPVGEYSWGEEVEIQIIDYDYQIMKYEITNAEYKQYLNEALEMGSVWLTGNYVVGHYPGDENISAGNQSLYHLGFPSSSTCARINFYNGEFLIYEPSGYNNGEFDNHPVAWVSWFGAWAFAQHYDLRLPTEQEWEKAARGITGYEYPWGNSISGDRANYEYSGDPWDNSTTLAGYYNGQNGTTDSPSPYGVYDMCGNVFEWTDSWLNSGYRVLRGGCWHHDSTSIGLRSWCRAGSFPTSKSYGLGFRCARSI